MVTDWMDVLLLHLIRDPKSIERLAGKIEPVDIVNQTMDGTKGFLWRCSREYFLKTGQPIPKHFMESYLVDRVTEGSMSPEEIDTVGMILDFIYSVDPKEMNTGMALESAKRLLETVRVHRPVQDMLQEGSTVAEIFETFQTGLAAAAVNMAEPIDPMASWETLIGTVKPEPLGGADVKYFNMMVNGGLMPGEIVVMLGPMGGYKTTIAIDVVCSMAKMHQHSLFCSYEQSYKGGDLPIRFMARMSGVDRDILLNTPTDQLDPAHKAALDAGHKDSHYSMFLDRSQHSDQVADIAAVVRHLAGQGRLPKFIVIDQLMTWMGLWSDAKGSEQDSWFRKRSTEVIKELKSQVCEKYGTTMLVLHQITAGAIGKRGGQSFAHNESAENKGIGFWADFVLTIGTKDKEHDVFKMVGGKTRRGPSTSALVKALPSTCKFRFADDFEEDNNTGGFVKKGQRNLIPSTIDTSKMRGADAVC